MPASKWNTYTPERKFRYKVTRWKREIRCEREGLCRSCLKPMEELPSFLKATRCKECLRKAHI